MEEHEIIEAIGKLSKQLDYHCNPCSSSDHSDLLQQAIDDLQLQLKEAREGRGADS